MIVANQKPINEIQGFLEEHKRVMVLGCGTCVTVCLAGGEREVAELSSILKLSSSLEILENTIERQCDEEFFDTVKDDLLSCDAVLSMACGIGVQMVANIFPSMPVYPALDTSFMGTNDDAGRWTENCLACGYCKLADYGGVCPVARCSKSMSNGPCGGSIDGKCEVDPENIECGWQLIFNRLKALDKLDDYTEIVSPKDWSPSHSGGPRKVTREDIAGI
jgi:hypothetical protein